MTLTQRLALTFLIACWGAGCATQDASSLVADLSPSGGESMTKMRDPIYLTAVRPGLSRVGKDYLFASPVTVAGSGPTQSYLWFAIGSTIDRVLAGAPAPDPRSILLVIDGVPMTFDLRPWSEAAQYEPYELDVKTHVSYAALITRSQIEAIANATELTAFVTSKDHRSPEYSLRDGKLASWLEF